MSPSNPAVDLLILLVVPLMLTLTFVVGFAALAVRWLCVGAWWCVRRLVGSLARSWGCA